MTMNEKIAAQRAEFDAMAELARQYRRLEMTPVVDDDYSAVRADYESALAAFMLAANGRQLDRAHKMGVAEGEARTIIEWGKDQDTFALLRRLNLRRVPRFGHGDISDPHGWGPMQWGCAIAGEVGELCNLLKKHQRQMPSDPSQAELEAMIQDEIADVVIYLDLLAALFAVDMRRAVARKFNRTSAKFGFPERFLQEAVNGGKIKCDGNHGGPPCADLECWARD